MRLALFARTAVDEFERGRLDRATAQKRLDAVVDEPWFPLIYMDRTFSDPDKSGWAKELRHDPLASIGSISAKTLILYGAGDPWVPVAVSMERLRTFTARHPKVTAAVVAGADRAMMTNVLRNAAISRTCGTLPRNPAPGARVSQLQQGGTS